MPNTFELIASYTATGSVSNIEFTSIPNTYTDLVLVTSCRTSRTGDLNDGLKVTFNNVGTNYSSNVLYGSGSSAAAFTATTFFGGWATTASATSSTFANSICYIPNYTGSANKSGSTDAVTENNASTAFQFLAANLWSNTAVISSLKIESSTGNNIVQHSTAYLYGVKNA